MTPPAVPPPSVSSNEKKQIMDLFESNKPLRWEARASGARTRCVLCRPQGNADLRRPQGNADLCAGLPCR
jgi:hypothetical protein